MLSIFFQRSILQHHEIVTSVSNTFSNSEQPPSVNQHATLRTLLLLVPIGLLSLFWTSVVQHSCPCGNCPSSTPSASREVTKWKTLSPPLPEDRVLAGNRWQPQSGNYEDYLTNVFALGTGCQKPELLQHSGEEQRSTAATMKLKTREVS